MDIAPKPRTPLVAVDIGNSRLKFGLFDASMAPSNDTLSPLVEPVRAIDLPPDPAQFDRLLPWLAPALPAQFAWHVGSVNRGAASLLESWLIERESTMRRLTFADLPLDVRVPRPELVGIDRLLDAVAANLLRSPAAPAVVIDVGTAITVDLVDVNGAFLGGAILPGTGTTARALHEFTDLLPRIEAPGLTEPPPAIGDSTVAAMRSGLYWGAIGGVRQLVELFARHVSAAPEIFLTGGAAPSVAANIGAGARYVPHLTLAGIAVSAQRAAP